MVIKGGTVSPLRKIFKGRYKKCECPGKDGKGCKSLIPVLKKDRPVFQRFAWQHQHIGKFGREAVGYKTGIVEDKSRGYATIMRRHHKYADKRGRVYLHRYLKELDLGYYITKEYDVDHIDKNTRNNAPENLRVLLKSDHTVYHHTIDMSNRRCVICNRKYEDIKVTHQRHWYENTTVCFYCNLKEKRKKGLYLSY